MNIVNLFRSSILLEMNFLFQVLDRQEDQIEYTFFISVFIVIFSLLYIIVFFFGFIMVFMFFMWVTPLKFLMYHIALV